MTTTVPTRHSALEITGDLAVFTLNRPEVRNCLSLQLSDELVAALEKIRRADSVKFLVLRGAGVDGYAVGGGLEITMACDFVIGTARAQWGMPEVDMGITPGWAAPPGSRDSWAGAWPRSST